MICNMFPAATLAAQNDPGPAILLQLSTSVSITSPTIAFRARRVHKRPPGLPRLFQRAAHGACVTASSLRAMQWRPVLLTVLLFYASGPSGVHATLLSAAPSERLGTTGPLVVVHISDLHLSSVDAPAAARATELLKLGNVLGEHVKPHVLLISGS